MQQIPANTAVDFIERALGVYQSDRRAALVRTINPLWWLSRGLLWFARIPFVFLDGLFPSLPAGINEDDSDPLGPR